MEHALSDSGDSGGICCKQVLPGGMARTPCVRVVLGLSHARDACAAPAPLEYNAAARSKKTVSADACASHVGSLHKPFGPNPLCNEAQSSVRKRKKGTGVSR